MATKFVIFNSRLRFWSLCIKVVLLQEGRVATSIRIVRVLWSPARERSSIASIIFNPTSFGDAQTITAEIKLK